MGASLHTANRGVSALGASLATLIWRYRPEASISLLIGNRVAGDAEVSADGTLRALQTVNYRLSPRGPVRQQLWWILLLSGLYRVIPVPSIRRLIARSTPWISAIVDAQFIGDIRGGDSFSDIYGLKNFSLDFLAVLSVIWIRGGLHLLPQTYGPFRSRLSERMAHFTLLRAHSIWCRDRLSMEEVSRLTGGRKRGILCPDVAFALDTIRPASPAIDTSMSLHEGDTLIGLNVSGVMYNGRSGKANRFGLMLDYRMFLRRLLEQLLTNTSNRVLLVPHTFAAAGRLESDPAACRDLVQRLPPKLRSRVHLVTQAYDQHEIKGIIGMCDFFIGSRLHACIAALSQGIPTVAIAYSRKFVGVFDTVGAGDWVIDARSADIPQALARFQEFFERRDAHRGILRIRVAQAQTELDKSFQDIVNAASADKGKHQREPLRPKGPVLRMDPFTRVSSRALPNRTSRSIGPSPPRS
jgi:colanic acid/amylovoran biosynthesis protein